MKRFIASALLIALTSSVGLVGCGDESSVKKEETVTSPTGTTTTTSDVKVESSGSNPPANSAGQTAEPPK